MDHLSILPVELLVHITAELPMSNFLSLVQTSKFFQRFMRTNAKDICNRRVLTEFALEHSCFITTTREDWIVPCLNVGDFASFQNHTDLVADSGPEYLLSLEQFPCRWRFLLRLTFDGKKTGNWAFTHHWLARFLYKAKDNGYKLPKDLL